MAEEKKLKPGSWQPLYVGDPKWDILFLMPANCMKVWLYHYARENKQRESWPGLRTIASKCGMHPDTVIDCRKWLKDNGWLIKVREISKEDGEFNVPVFRVERGNIPEKTTRKKVCPQTKSLSTDKTSVGRTDKKSVLPQTNHLLDAQIKSLTEPVSVEPISIEPVPVEPVPTVVDLGVRRTTPDKTGLEQAKVVTDPEELKIFLADSPDAGLTIQRYMELSGHYLFKKKLHPKDRELMAAAFEKLLGTEPEQHVINVLAYMAASPQFSRGAATVAKEYPWDWFCSKFDQMAAAMDADDAYRAKLRARIQKEAGESIKALAKAKQNVDKPLYRQIDGEEATKNSTILKF